MARDKSKNDLLTISHGRIFDKPSLDFRNEIAPILGISTEDLATREITAVDVLYETFATTFTLELMEEGLLTDEMTLQRVSDELFRLIRMTETLRDQNSR